MNLLVKHNYLLIPIGFLFSFSCLHAQNHPFCIVPPSGSLPECEQITCTLCNLNGFTSTTAGFGPDIDGDLFFFGWCGGNLHVQYIQFYAAEAFMNITVTATNCSPINGIDLGISPGCDIPFDYCITGNGSNSTTLNVGPLTVGQVYVLTMNTDMAGTCNLTVTVDPPTATIPLNNVGEIDDIQGDLLVCPQEVTHYFVSPVEDGVTYNWTVPAGAHINLVIGSGQEVIVDWGNSNGGDICVSSFNACPQTTHTLCKTVSVVNIPPTILPALKVCSDDLPYQLPWGAEVTMSGTYTTALTSVEGCDSVLKQPVIVLPPIVHNLPVEELCEGSCITRFGQSFCDYGTYAAVGTSYQGCDSTVNFTLVPPNIHAEIQGSGNLTCSQHSLILSSSQTGGTVGWYNSAGQSLGISNSLTVTGPGTYILEVKKILPGGLCVALDSVTVLWDTLPPALSVMGDTLGCDTLPVLVHVSSNANPAQYDWTGPNGFMSSAQNPVVMQIGTYLVHVLNPVNGCSSTDSVRVVPCCGTKAGTFDTLLATVCGQSVFNASYHEDAFLESGDSLTYILYANPANPLGSILMYADTTIFLFVPGVIQYDVTYYVAALLGPIAPDHSILTDTSSCWSLSNGQPVRWVQKPVISLASAPTAVCKGDCMDVAFDFTGTPPFQFHLGIMQNGNLLYSKDLISNSLHQIFSICPADFIQPLGSGPLNFTVGYFQDKYCSCGN